MTNPAPASPAPERTARCLGCGATAPAPSDRPWSLVHRPRCQARLVDLRVCPVCEPSAPAEAQDAELAADHGE